MNTQNNEIKQVLDSTFKFDFAHIIEDSFISKEFEFQSLFSFKISVDCNSNLTYSSEITLNKKDCDDITDILFKDSIIEHHYYKDFYRVNLQEYILVFKHYVLPDNSRMFMGYMLKNSPKTKLNLAEVFQNYIYGQLAVFI